MLRHGITIGKLFGIPIRIDASWILIFIWVTVSLGSQYARGAGTNTPVVFAWGSAVVTSLLFFTSVLIHELSHSLVARKLHVPVNDITLFIFGGMAQINEEPKTPRDELLMAGAGPLASLLLAGLFFVASLLARAASPLVRAPLVF